MDKSARKRADKTESILDDLRIHGRSDVDEIGYYMTEDFKDAEEVRKKNFSECDVGFSWERRRNSEESIRLNADTSLLEVGDVPRHLSIGNNVWFKLKFEIPEEMAGKPVNLRFSVKPEKSPKMGPGDGKPGLEALCYREGEPWQAFDQGHNSLLLTENAEGGDQFDLLIEVGTTMLWGGLDVDSFHLETAEIYSVREAVEELFWNFKLLNDLRKQLEEGKVYRRKILKCLQKASNVFPLQSEDEDVLADGSRKALRKLKPVKDVSSDISEFKLVTAGHAHIDAAWLWPWSETIRKCGRTFSTVLKLMGEYPDFRFVQSQPHLYEFARERYPGVFERISEKVEEGRWEPVGALWIESDVNISGSESLARQYLMGKRYFRDKFDVDPKITFIPDVFGYSASLPNIADAADCPYFFTQKMSWNEINEFPHHTFRWEGTNGSEVLAHFPPSNTYAGMTHGEGVEEVKRSAEEFKENDELDRASYLIGWSDGGGGPTRDMIKQIDVMNEIDALPDLEFGSLRGFFDYLDDQREVLSKWVGELYLEKHRGTLTSQAKTKRNNRKGEFALREAEIWSSLAKVRNEEFDYRAGELNKAWKVLLFNQFHDILPGSSIREVYEDAKRDYTMVFETANREYERAFAELVSSRKSSDLASVFNSLSWDRDILVSMEYSDPNEELVAVDSDGDKSPVQASGMNENEILFKAKDVPALGYDTFRVREGSAGKENGIEAEECRLENSLIRVEFDENGFLTSVWDKESGREALGGRGNLLMAYRDIPAEFDAWDIEEDLYEVGDELPEPTEVEVMEDGPLRATVRQIRHFGDSKIVQDIMIYHGSKRVDFETCVEWHESDTFLKTHFPINVHSNEANFEVQYGHVSRPTHENTSWDKARFEVPHQKWLDVSEYGYGVALMNDCKYGAGVKGTDVNLSLLRAPKSPDPQADQGEHRFTYSLFPHKGDFRESGVIEESYELNVPLLCVPVERMEGSDHLLDLNGRGAILEAVKESEGEGDKLVLRLYEAWGRSVEISLEFNFDVERVFDANLIEDENREIGFKDNRIELSLDPFEIRTIVVDT